MHMSDATAKVHRNTAEMVGKQALHICCFGAPQPDFDSSYSADTGRTMTCIIILRREQTGLG